MMLKRYIYKYSNKCSLLFSRGPKQKVFRTLDEAVAFACKDLMTRRAYPLRIESENGEVLLDHAQIERKYLQTWRKQ
jgi:hypothetical protein